MRVLVACEYSGRVRDAFLAMGHDAISCDMLPSESNAGPHYQGDVFDLIGREHFDLMIAHPPCTYLTNSGVCWLHKDPNRWALLDEGAAFFKRLLHAPIAKKCIENPIMHKYARERVGCNKTQVIQPWMFGHLEQKATCLWLDGLPPLRPTNVVRAEMMKLPKRERERLHYCSPGPDRWKERSRTYEGIANAMAAQWGQAPNEPSSPAAEGSPNEGGKEFSKTRKRLRSRNHFCSLECYHASLCNPVYEFNKSRVGQWLGWF